MTEEGWGTAALEAAGDMVYGRPAVRGEASSYREALLAWADWCEEEGRDYHAGLRAMMREGRCPWLFLNRQEYPFGWCHWGVYGNRKSALVTISNLLSDKVFAALEGTYERPPEGEGKWGIRYYPSFTLAIISAARAFQKIGETR